MSHDPHVPMGRFPVKCKPVGYVGKHYVLYHLGLIGAVFMAVGVLTAGLLAIGLEDITLLHFIFSALWTTLWITMVVLGWSLVGVPAVLFLMLADATFDRAILPRRYRETCE
ncbi:MAG: hypothetical protein AAGJ50_03275 [Pseudomonadota bacterium]